MSSGTLADVLAERARDQAARGVQMGLCRSCSASVTWLSWEDASGNPRRGPYNPDGTSHFSSCPDAAKWRKGKRRKV